MNYFNALRSLRPNSSFEITGGEFSWIVDEKTEQLVPDSNLVWLDTATTIPSKEELDAEVVRLEQNWIDTEYQRLRQPEYPPLADLADALYWQAQGDESKMTAYLAAVEAVKQKYPKGV